MSEKVSFELKGFLKFKMLPIICLIALFLNSCTKDKNLISKNQVSNNNADKVLFIGNSLTFYNGGLNQLLLNMLNADDPGHNYKIEMAAKSGYTLQNHFNDNETLAKLASDKWSWVVLQDNSSEPYNLSIFNEYSRKLDALIKNNGSKTIFYMTWARRDKPDSINSIAKAYTDISTELGATLAPVGRVWEYSSKVNPQIALHIADNLHPTESGTYLTACVFYIAIWGKNPIGNNYAFGSISAADRKILQQTAWNYMKIQVH